MATTAAYYKGFLKHSGRTMPGDEFISSLLLQQEQLRDYDQIKEQKICVDIGLHTRPRRLPVYTESPIIVTEISPKVESLPDDIATSIEESRKILDLADDWDDEGSPGYQESTWQLATCMIKDIIIAYLNDNKLDIPIPSFMPGPDGSIDIHWEAKGRELLINVPADENLPAGYYGTGGAKDTIKGKLDPSSQNKWILNWLMR